jgi:hypothetical protein
MCNVATLCELRDTAGCSPGAEAKLVAVPVPPGGPTLGLGGLALVDDMLVRAHVARLDLVLHEQAAFIKHMLVCAHVA